MRVTSTASSSPWTPSAPPLCVRPRYRLSPRLGEPETGGGDQPLPLPAPRGCPSAPGGEPGVTVHTREPPAPRTAAHESTRPARRLTAGAGGVRPHDGRRPRRAPKQSGGGRGGAAGPPPPHWGRACGEGGAPATAPLTACGASAAQWGGTTAPGWGSRQRRRGGASEERWGGAASRPTAKGGVQCRGLRRMGDEGGSGGGQRRGATGAAAVTQPKAAAAVGCSGQLPTDGRAVGRTHEGRRRGAAVARRQLPSGSSRHATCFVYMCDWPLSL